MNKTLSITKDFDKVPEARAECRIFHLKPDTRQQYKMCAEQDCEELVFTFDQRKSMIEILELHEDPLLERQSLSSSKDGANVLGKIPGHGSRRIRRKSGSPAVQKDPRVSQSLWMSARPIQSRKLYLGETSVMRALIQPASTRRRQRIHVQSPLSLENFRRKKPSLPPPRSIRSGSNQQSRTSTRRMNGCTVAYCDVKNHTRFSCNHLHKHQSPTSKHSCTLCMGSHPPFLCSRAQVNNGIAKPNCMGQARNQAGH